MKSHHLLLLLITASSGLWADDYPFPGNPPITPRWAYEPWVWEDETNTQASTTQLVADYQSRGIPVGVVIIDSPWTSHYMSFAFDNVRYPDPQSMINGFRVDGIEVVCWMAGMVNSTATDVPNDLHPDFDFVRTQNYQVSDPDGDDLFDWWKGTGLAIDFTNPAAVNWFMGNNNASLIAMGVRGFKVDEHNAYLNTSSGMLETSSGSVHSGGQITKQEYTETYYAKVYDWIHGQTAGTDYDGMIIARPYSHQGQPGGFHCPVSKLTAGWCGDFAGDWSGFSFQVSNVHTSIDAGYSAVGFEVGGYQGAQPTRDSLLRQAQYAALLPVMENGGTNGGLTAHLPWYWDGGGSTTATDIYRYYATLHHNLAPFQFHCGVVAHLTGQKAVTQIDPSTLRHVLGETFLTRAVMGGEGAAAAVNFPAGLWIDWWDQSAVYPGETTLSRGSPLAEAPLFVRSGAIVPVAVDSAVTGLGDASSAGKESVLVFPHGSSSLTYHRALTDGISYENVVLSCDEAAGTVTVNSPASRDWLLRVKSFAAPVSVTGADSWSYDAANEVVIVEKTGASFTVTIDGLDAYSSVTPIDPDALPQGVVNVATLSGSGQSSATISDFSLYGGNALVVLVATEGSGATTDHSVSFGGQNVVNKVIDQRGSASAGVSQAASVFYLIDAGVTAGDVVVTFDNASTFSIAAVSLEHVVAAGDSHSFNSGAGSGSVDLSYTGIGGGIVVASLADNGYEDSAPSIGGGNISHFLEQVAGTFTVSAGRVLALGEVTSDGSHSETFTWGNNDSSRNAGALVAFVVDAPSAYETWRHGFFASYLDEGDAASDADPDGDGQANLLEYALGTNPLEGNSMPVGMSATSPPTYTFPRIADPTLLYEVHVSNDLQDWTTVLWSSSGQPAEETLENIPLFGGLPHEFARLKVTISE